MLNGYMPSLKMSIITSAMTEGINTMSKRILNHRFLHHEIEKYEGKKETAR